MCINFFIYNFFLNYIYIFIIIFILIIYNFFLKNNKIQIIFFKIINNFFYLKNFNLKKINWIDIWEININISRLENINYNSWNLYYKYKLSLIKTWHILEDRITVFFIFFLNILFIY